MPVGLFYWRAIGNHGQTKTALPGDALMSGEGVGEFLAVGVDQVIERQVLRAAINRLPFELLAADG